LIVTSQADGAIGVEVREFDPRSAPSAELDELLELVYQSKIVILKDQDLSAQEFVDLGRRLGEPEIYYQPMYHHPELKEIFVSSNADDGGTPVGVPKTGQCWHADYQFMPRPFGITMVYPQVVPARDRGTYFIDMTAVYRDLPDSLKAEIDNTQAKHSPRRHFKIRPSDVYRPVHQLLDEIERETPEVAHPTVFEHPVTGERVLYISEGLTCGIVNPDGSPAPDGLLASLLGASGQLDPSYEHDYIHLQFLHKGDLLVWDNRALVHRARHTNTNETAVSYRVTVHDGHPFYNAATPALT
jgi:taurine dioxygenase